MDFNWPYPDYDYEGEELPYTNAWNMYQQKEKEIMTTKPQTKEESVSMIATVSPRLNLDEKKGPRFLFKMPPPKRLKDNPHGLLQIHIESEILEDFFLSVCPDRDQIKAGNIKEFCWESPKLKKPDGSPIYLMKLDKHITPMTGKYSDDLMLTDFKTPNMCILTAVGLKSGIDFVSNAMFSKDAIDELTNGLQVRIRNLFDGYIKSCSTEIEIRIKEIL